MRKIKVFAVIASIVFLAACGSGSGGGGSADTQAEHAAETFFGILEFCGITNVAAQLDAGMSEKDVSKQVTECACPNGGTLDVNAGVDTIVLTATNCQSADGQNFDGNIIIDNNTDEASVDMDDFGDDCSSVEAPNLNFNEGSCSGTLTVTCNAGTATCTLVEPETPGEGCDAQCT
jgi:hypothetical protein